MCGICGHISFLKKPQTDSVLQLVQQIKHRGPDDKGIWSSDNGYCIFGHTRLSIIDLSSSGHQPMYDSQTGNSIVFNGEIYNFKELREWCKLRGEKFYSHSDTEVILALYRLIGVECLQKLRGMFAFAIWDEQQQHLFVARDRVGKKPFNYINGEEGFIFCSEIHPLSKYPGIKKEIDAEALDLYLQFQYIPAPWTIYKSIRKLPPATYGIFNRNRFTLHRYWKVNYSNKIRISEEEALEMLDEKLTEAVRLRMIADVPVGALLSGGVDSSLIVAIMAKLNKERVHTYSIGFEEQQFNELPFAKLASDKSNTIHHPEIVKGDVINLLPHLIRHYGEPYADSSAIPSFKVCESARRNVTVALNGDGGDELLGGYPRYSLFPFQMKYSSIIGDVIPGKLAAYLGLRILNKKTTTTHKLIHKYLFGYLRPELRSLTNYSPFFDEELTHSLLQHNRSRNSVHQWVSQWFQEASEYADHPFDRMLSFDNNTYLPGDLLAKMDIASMHCGLETRSPLLDHELIEFCATLPVDLKYKNGQGKYLLKRLAEKYFPRDFVYRPKMGFGIPVFDWLQGPLREVLLDTLHSNSLMDLFNRNEIDQQLAPFLDGKNYNKERLWVLLMFGIWKNEYFK